MLLKYFYDSALAHASYIVGCQREKTAVVIDPGRDVQQYLEFAWQEGLQLMAVAETHIHADYVSGARELAEQVGAKLYLSDAGPSDWKYRFADQYDSQLLQDGDKFSIGKIQFETVHTPGHTPESISFVLTDKGGGANQPMGIFTGDFIFVGSIGRPDLLEEAAGIQGSAKSGAVDLYHSAMRFKQLPDFLQVWPAHGAGSACGKGLGAIPSSTVGYEKLFNPALAFDQQDEFVQYILSDQPEAPKYFSVMKRVNKEGPQVLGNISSPERMSAKSISLLRPEATIVDLSTPHQFAAGHVPGAINIPGNLLAAWAGWLIDYSEPLYLIADQKQLGEAVRILHKIGIDQIAGVFDPEELRSTGIATQQYQTAAPEDLLEQIKSGEVDLVDVRSDAEWNAGHIEQAKHLFLGRLPEQLATLQHNRPVVTQCQSGMRAAIAASIIQATGRKAINMAGGLAAWQAAGLPVESTSSRPTSCSI